MNPILNFLRFNFFFKVFFLAWFAFNAFMWSYMNARPSAEAQPFLVISHDRSPYLCFSLAGLKRAGLNWKELMSRISVTQNMNQSVMTVAGLFACFNGPCQSNLNQKKPHQPLSAHCRKKKHWSISAVCGSISALIITQTNTSHHHSGNKSAGERAISLNPI